MITVDYRLGLKGVRGVTQTEFAGLLDNAIRMAVEDLFSATEYLVKNGKSMGIDPDNLVVTGSSAGAITVQQAEWVLCNRAADGRPGVAGRASSSGLCDYSHVADGLPEDFNYKGVMAFAGAVMVNGTLDYAVEPCPVMMFHGSEDELVPYDIVRAGTLAFCGPCQIQKALESAGGTCRLDGFTDSAKKIRRAFVAYFRQIVNPNYPIRRLGVGLNNLQDAEYARLDLFTDLTAEKREHDLQRTVIDLRRRFGKNAVLHGLSLGEKATARRRNRLIGGHNSGEEQPKH